MLNGIPFLNIFSALSEAGKKAAVKSGSSHADCRAAPPPPHTPRPGNLCQMQERMSKVFKVGTWSMGGNISATRKTWITSTTLST